MQKITLRMQSVDGAKTPTLVGVAEPMTAEDIETHVALQRDAQAAAKACSERRELRRARAAALNEFADSLIAKNAETR